MTTLEKNRRNKKSFFLNFQKLDRIVNKTRKDKNVEELITLLRLYNFFDNKLHNFDKKLSNF